MTITSTACHASRALTQAPAAPPLQAPAAPPPATDIYLVALPGGLSSMKTAKPVPVSVAAGYDNQPNFSPDGNRILFAANRDGKQIDVYAFDRGTSRVTQLTQTAENENSPTHRAGGCGFRRQLHRGPIRIREVGREAGQPDSAAVALQRPGQVAGIDPRRHQPGGVSRVDRHRSTGVVRARCPREAVDVAESRASRRERRRSPPKTSAVRYIAFPERALASFVHREPVRPTRSSKSIRRRRSIEPLIDAVQGSSERDMAWMPDGKTILMSVGQRRCFRGRADSRGWTEVFDGAPHNSARLRD